MPAHRRRNMYLFSHRSIWDAIDALADRHKLSVSGLARLAGLDATAFNPSKRTSKDGRSRWPSTESIAKILQVTHEGYDQFMSGDIAYVQDDNSGFGQNFAESSQQAQSVPLLGFAQAGAGGFFDPAGFPVGQGWEEINFPGSNNNADACSTYALEVAGDSMIPAYRDGDILIVSPSEQVRRGDRVVVRTKDGEVTAKTLHRQNEKSVELHSLNPDHAPRILKRQEVEWIARILWASQ